MEVTERLVDKNGVARRQILPLALRFWRRVDRDGPTMREELGPCWIWTGGYGPAGYGRINLGCTGEGSDNVHRVSWKLTRGEISAGLFVCHSCDHKPCVRPEHLFLGTNDDNVADMVAKGRQCRGELRSDRLTTSDIIDIRTLAGQTTHAALGVAFGISREHARDIVNRKRWTHV